MFRFRFLAFVFKIRANKNRRLCRFATGVAGTNEKGGKLGGDEETSILPLWYQDSSPPTLACGLNSRKSSLPIPSTTPESMLESFHFQLFSSDIEELKHEENLVIRSFSSIIFFIIIFRIPSLTSIENNHFTLNELCTRRDAIFIVIKFSRHAILAAPSSG